MPRDGQPASTDSGHDLGPSVWPSIIRIIILEIGLLVVLAGALVVYLTWSSEAAIFEFTDAVIACCNQKA
jgi:hypothetical protein